ncbi:hypothetical protein AB870_04000 [Pandoraea faecigallinarum]|uniref:Uncharacterized protein n=1 Tax=Pandoraea faecigallinarum TaxID=656179 RepID=A0A0H3WSB6_9BURK|nr:ankyrin repeat domain-containing protein [Pandoraea faecigallinarum]AKM29473.1 hypothetical protein AB870_04000 [Pandoraea faecigallinarum]
MPGTPPITTHAHSTSTTSDSGNVVSLHYWPIESTALSAMTLSELLATHPRRTAHSHQPSHQPPPPCGSPPYRTQDIWNTLANTQSRAGRELREACDMACGNGPLFLEMVTLLATPESERTVDKLADAGLFLVPDPARHLRADDAALLRSNEGLLLWLQYAASPTGYLNVFDGSDVFGSTSTSDRDRIGKILRILIACGRDRTTTTPTSRVETAPLNPLSHLCSQVAPHWLRRVLELGANPNQRNQRGMPLTTAAMRAEALRLHHAGQDVMHAHASLHRLAELLKRHGGDLLAPNRRGVPSVALLAFHGLCGAAHALLASGADPNAADAQGNTLMHHLAHAVSLRDDPTHSDNARLAHYMLIVASRYGGDLGRVNANGHAAREWLPQSLTPGPHAGPIDDEFRRNTRATALRRIKALG